MSDDMIQTFESLVPLIESETDGSVHLVRIVGQRWSYVAGRMPEDSSFVAPQRVILDDHWALMFYPGNGADIDREQIRDLFRKHLEAREPAGKEAAAL